MSAPPHKSHPALRRGVAGIAAFLFIALFVTDLWGHQPPAKRVAPPLVDPAWEGNMPLDIAPERAQELLAEMALLQLPSHGPAGAGVKSRLLCFCLHKGPEAVRELRRVAAERFVEGVAAFERGAYPEAVEAFSQAIRRYPSEARAYVNRGLAHARLGHFQDAKADLTQAVARNRQLADAYYGRGLVALYLGEGDQAQADLKRAAQLGDERALRLSPAGIPRAQITGG